MLRAATTAIVLSWFAGVVSGQLRVPLIASLERYAAGDFDAAIHAIIEHDMARVREAFAQDVPPWVEQEPQIRSRAAAAFVLELVEATIATEFGRFLDLMEHICRGLRVAAMPDRFELAWHRASPGDRI